jgi:DNA-binding transcriptional MerR regulator
MVKDMAIRSLSNPAAQTHLLKIGQVAEQTGVAVGTLRYYENLGLLAPDQRSESGYRYYTPEAVRQVRFIKKAQTLQFSLADIQKILGVRHQGQTACPLVRDLLQQKISELNTHIQQMQHLKAQLEDYQTRWASYPDDPPHHAELCSLIEEVADQVQA